MTAVQEAGWAVGDSGGAPTAEELKVESRVELQARAVVGGREEVGLVVGEKAMAGVAMGVVQVATTEAVAMGAAVRAVAEVSVAAVAAAEAMAAAAVA